MFTLSLSGFTVYGPDIIQLTYILSEISYIIHMTVIFFQLIGRALSDSEPESGAPWEFIDALFTMIEPSVDGVLRMFPFLRYLPGYYGDIYRQTKTGRDKVAKRFFDDQKVIYFTWKILFILKAVSPLSLPYISILI